MNSIFVVWIMIVQTSGGAWIPTLEFKTEAKCNAAVKTITDFGDTHKLLGRKPSTTVCIKIEK